MSWSEPSDRSLLDSEAWTTEVLVELRCSRFTPRAWVRLVTRSWARADTQRGRHPAAHRQTVVLGLVGGVAWLVPFALGRPWLGIAGVSWWIALILMVDWHLGMLERPDGSQLAGLGVANVITSARGGLVPLFPALDRSALVVAFAVFAALDVLDGRLARSRHESTRLGAWLDGSLDGVAAAVLTVSAERLGSVPLWLVLLVVARHAVPWLGAAVAYIALSTRPPETGLVSARLPGLVLSLGIALSLLRVAGGVTIATVGALAAIAASAGSVARALRALSAP